LPGVSGNRNVRGMSTPSIAGWPYDFGLILCALTVVGLGAPVVATAAAPAGSRFVYFGTYTGGASQGIYVARFDPATGELSAPRLAVEAVSPAFLAAHPDRPLLYAVNEVGSFKGQAGGAVSAFAIEAETGGLTLLNQESSRGGGPCHLTVDPSGRWVLVANYGGGSIAVLPLRPGGELGPASTFVQHSGSSVNAQRQTAPHAHGIYADPANRFVFVPDLGIDRVLVYRWAPATGELEPNDPAAAVLAPGAGPRHLVFHPGGRFAYVINELLNTVTGFEFDPQTGALREIQTIGTLPEGFRGGNSTAEIAVHPTGRFLYGSNRGHDSLVTYLIDASTGKLGLVGHRATRGRTPRNFAVDPSGGWMLVANQDSNNVAVFRVDPRTGLPEASEHSVDVPAPVCVLFR
jgi:6-phosphogluconolactonase